MFCVNTSNPKYKKLLNDSKLPSLLLEMRVSKYMELNDGKFPELEDIIIPNNQSLYQLTSKNKTEAIQNLDNYLLDFLKSFGVKSKEFDELKSKLGVDALGATDLLNKLIWYTKNRNEETVPEEAAHMLVMLMGINNPIIQDLLKNITSWSEYSNIYNNYIDIYKDVEKVKIEAVGKLVAKSLVKNYKTYGNDKTLIQKALKLIEEFINKLKDSFFDSNYSYHLADKIALNVLNGNTDFINKVTNKSNLSYKGALENNPRAKQLIDKFIKIGAVLTGSLAIAGNNENIQRDSSEYIHDIDFRLNKYHFQDMLNTVNDLKGLPIHKGWIKDEFTTYSFFIPKEGFSIQAIKLNNTGWIEGAYTDNPSINIFDKNGNNYGNNKEYYTIVDFFVRHTDFKIKSQFLSWQEVFKGKLELLSSKSKSKYFFNREKDQQDYVNINPKNRFEKSDDNFIYYQLEDILYSNEVTYQLKTSKIILDNLFKIKQWESNKSIDNNTLYNKIQQLGVPKQQLDLLKESKGNTIEEKLTDFVANYSYTIEINTTISKTYQSNNKGYKIEKEPYDDIWYVIPIDGAGRYQYNSEKDAKNKLKELEIQEKEVSPTQHYSNLTVPGGTNYTEQEISTPLITPSIKGHAQFATDNGIGWFRSDDKTQTDFNTEPQFNPETAEWDYIDKVSKTRRILEVQSDLFQKGRDSKVLSKKLEIKKVGDTFISNGEKFTVTNIDTDSELYELITIQDSQGRTATMRRTQLEKRFDERGDNSSDNQFLQLLNKDNNWVTFFIKSIIQDSVKKGYEKVLFPTGNTASKVEGHTTLEEFKKEKEDKIKKLEKENKEIISDSRNIIGFYIKNNEYYRVNLIGEDYQVSKETYEEVINEVLEKNNNEINQLKQELERVEKEGFGALKPIYNFYENTVTNILKKQGYNPSLITDEYGNTWNEISLNKDRDLDVIQFNREQTIKPGVSELFEQNPELAAIGTQEQYSQYLDTIFPDSKVKDILHHGVVRGEVKDFDKFSNINQSSGTWGIGYYFAPIDNKFFENAPINKYVVINSKNIITEKEHKQLFEDYKEKGFQGTKGLADTNSMFREVREKYDTIDARDREIVVFEPEQIHILGSKQDIEGFKDYILNQKTNFDKESYQKQDNDRATDVVIKLLDRLSNNTNTTYELIDEKVAYELLGDRYDGEIGFFYQGKVYLIKDKLNSKTAIHEFSHPFVDIIFDTNTDLFEKLYNQLVLTPEGVKIEQYVKENYKEYSEDNQKKEVFVRVLTNVALKNTNNEESKKIYDKILFFIKQLFRKLFKTDVSKLSLNTTIDDLANILLNNNIKIISKPISQEDLIQFDRENKEIAKELFSLKTNNLIDSISLAANVINQLNQNVRNNTRYNDIKESLTTNEGNLLKKALNIINKSKNVEEDNQKAVNLAYTLTTVREISNNLVNRIMELNADKTLSETQKMSTLSYYSYFLTEWDYFVEEFKNILNSEKIPGSSAIRVVLSSIESNIASSFKELSNNSFEANVELIYEMLTSTNKNIEKTMLDYMSMLEDKAKKGNQKAASKLEELKKQNNTEKFSKDVIRQYLLGNMGDANFFSGFVQAFISNGDPIVASFQKFIDIARLEVESNVRNVIQKMSNEVDPLYKQANIDRSNPALLGEMITFLDEIAEKDKETGGIKKGKVITLLNKYKNYRFDIDDLKSKIELAKQEGRIEDYRNLKQDLKNLEEKWFNREFVDSYYNLQKIWDSPVGRIAKEKRDEILEEIRNIDDTLSKDLTIREEQLEDKRMLLRKLGRLSSLVDINNNPKVDTIKAGEQPTFENSQLSIALLIKKYQEESREFYEESEKIGLFEQRYEEEKQRLLDLNLSKEDFEKNINNWISKNTRTVIKQSFYQDREIILNQIKALYDTLPDRVKNEKSFDEIWDKILNITKGFRDKDGQPMGSDLSENQLSQIKNLQEDLEKLKQTLAGFTGLSKVENKELSYYFDLKKSKITLTLEQEERLTELLNKKDSKDKDVVKNQKALFLKLLEDLNALQSKIPTVYYLNVLNEFLAPENITVDEATVELFIESPKLSEYLNKYPEFKKWFLNNHYLVDKYDPQSNSTYPAYQRTYAWSRIVPNNDNYYEIYGTMKDGRIIKGIPTNEYFNRNVKNEFRTLKWLRKQKNLSDYSRKKLKELEEKESKGSLVSYVNEKITHVNVDHQGRWLPKDLPDSPYINNDYEKLRNNNPTVFKILEVYTKYFLEAQKGAGYSNKLGYDLPRYWISDIEQIRDGSKKRDFSNKIRTIGESIQNLFKKSADDFTRGVGNYSEEFAERMVFTDMYGNRINKIPITGLSKIPVEQTSKNIGVVISRYISSIELNKKLIEINPIAESLLDTVKTNGIKHVSDMSYNIWSRTGVKMLAKQDKNNRLEILQNIYQKQFLGVNKKGELPIFVDKTLNTLMRVAAWGTLATDIPGAVKNSFSANVQNFIESLGGKHSNLKSFAESKYEFSTKYAPNLIADYNKVGFQSLETQFVQAWDFVQGMYFTNAGENLGRSYLEKFFKLKWAFAAREFGEIEAQVSFGLSVLKNILVPQTINGITKNIKYSDAFELVNGIMVLKPGIDSKYAEGGQFFKETKMLIHDLTRNLQGNYAKTSSTEMEQYAFGRLFMFMRKYLVPMAMNRFGTERLQIGQATLKEGYYITSAKYAAKLLFKFKNDWSILKNEEKQNIIKTISEIMISLTFYLLLRMLGYNDNDDDKYDKLKDNNWLTNHLIYQLILVKSESEQFIPLPGFGLDELMRLKSNPSLALGHLDKHYKIVKDFVDILGNTIGVVDDEKLIYDRDYGIWDEGTYKIAAHAANLVGFKGTTFYPEVGIENISKVLSRTK